jgi:hypothetical protein
MHFTASNRWPFAGIMHFAGSKKLLLTGIQRLYKFINNYKSICCIKHINNFKEKPEGG